MNRWTDHTMRKHLDQMTRAELIAEIERLQAQSESVPRMLMHELDVHKEELEGQYHQLLETQKLLQPSRDDYVALYDFAPVPYLTLDPSGVVKAINLTGCTLLEVERDRIIGLPLTRFIDEQHRGAFLDHMRRCRTECQESVTTELVLKTAKSRPVAALLVSRKASNDAFRTVVFDRTETLRLDQTIRDINARLEERVKDRTAELERTNARLQAEIEQRQRVETELNESHRRKDEFLAMLGHELRNPLGPIRNAAALIELVSQDRDDLMQASAIIERQVQNMGRIVDDLLEVSRISQGKIKLVKEPVDFAGLLRQVLDDFQPQLESHSIRLNTDLFAGELWVDGDTVRLQQVVSNLLHNAYKFTDHGGAITVKLQYLRTLDETVLSIHDTGVGITSEMLPRLFVPFSQEDSSLDRTRGGLGLGLALVHGLVELHGGSVDAASPGAGQGSVFTVRLPLIATPKEAPTRRPVPHAQGTSLRILVIDDQRDAVLTLERLLARLGHKVYTAVNGEEGLRLARETHPQIIFSDIGLPGMSGYEVAKALRSDNETEPALLVAVTGYGRDEDMKQALAAGFDRHLVKPVAFTELTRMLNSV